MVNIFRLHFRYNGPLKEEVYVAQQEGSLIPVIQKKSTFLWKALYGLKQAQEPVPWCFKSSSWMSKKQNCTAMSSAEAEYVALSASCAQMEILLEPASNKALGGGLADLYEQLVTSGYRSWSSK
ncbi:hypothetical protein Tco_0720506 [Tanacetum coccineum]